MGIDIAIVAIGQIPSMSLVAAGFGAVLGRGHFCCMGQGGWNGFFGQWVWVLGVSVKGSCCWVCSGSFTSGQCCCIGWCTGIGVQGCVVGGQKLYMGRMLSGS